MVKQLQFLIGLALMACTKSKYLIIFTENLLSKMQIEIFYDKLVCLKDLNQFLLIRCRGFGFHEQAIILSQCSPLQFFGVIGLKGMIEFWSSLWNCLTTFGTGLFSWLVCGVLLWRLRGVSKLPCYITQFLSF